MVSGKKPYDMSNGATKQSMSSQGKGPVSGSNRTDGKSQNGNASSFRTDVAISGGRNQGEKVLQRWVPDPSIEPETSSSFDLGRKQGSHEHWDQFAENERRFGVTTDYDESIYTSKLDKAHPMYKQRAADAEKKAREIERSTTSNSHIAEERIRDNLGISKGDDEEDKYSGVRRQDFPPLTSSNNKYTPPARRPPTSQPTVSGAPFDPAIISTQKPVPSEKSKAIAVPKPTKNEKVDKAEVPVTTVTPSDTTSTTEVKPKVVPSITPSATTGNLSTTSAAGSVNRTVSPVAKPEAVLNHTATVERDVASAFKNFASQQRRNVEQVRSQKARNDKEVKLKDLKRFADSFKLNTPVPSDLVSIIAKDPAKQKAIQEKAKRNAEEANAHSAEAAKAAVASADNKSSQRPVAATHGTSPSPATSRQGNNRNQNLQGTQSFRGNERPQQPLQPMNVQQSRQQPPAALNNRLKTYDAGRPMQTSSIPVHEPRQPPTGPSNPMDAQYSRRSSGVTSAQGARLNPNSSEFRPSPHAAAFNPTSTASSPRSSVTPATPAVPTSKSLLNRKPVDDRPSTVGKFEPFNHIKSLKPAAGRDWKSSGGIRPAYETLPTWKQPGPDDAPESAIHMSYAQCFANSQFPPSMSPAAPHNLPQQLPHQHQLPFHLQVGGNPAPRPSPRAPQMNLPAGQHGLNGSFSGSDDHRMVPSHSAQSFSSPRPQNLPMQSYPSPSMNGAPLAFNPQMMPYGGAPPMQAAYRSMSQNYHMPQQAHMGQMMIPNGPGGFMPNGPGMPPSGPPMYAQQGQFMPPGNGHPPPMPNVNGYPSPGRGGAPMMMQQGSQQGHQQPIYGAMNPGMSPGPHYGNIAPIYAQQPPGQMPMRGYGNFGTSPQQMHQFQQQPPQHRNNHQNGNYNNNKSFQQHGPHANAPHTNGQHPSGPSPSQIPSAPQSRGAEGSEETK